MQAVTKTGKILHGKIAEILIKKGSATPYEGTEVRVKKVAPKKGKKTTPKKGKK
jgi:hypothetical protein